MADAPEPVPPFGFQLEFDAEGDPPRVWLADDSGRGTAHAEVMEEPTLISEDGKWSWNDNDWQPGPFADRLLTALNRSYGYES